MSVDQLTTQQPPRADDSTLVRYEDFIESKIQSTRWTVKAVDLATALVTLIIGVLAFLFVIALAEHWILPAGFSVFGRTVLFAFLIGGVGYFIYRRIWPLLVRAINPVYAARAIEQGTPTLKNSLINLLFFRERRTGISDAVYRTLEEQAAHRLTRVPVETSVDRSLLIHLGYGLIAVVALTSLYKVFSPKDPIISVERILLPWANIVPASRVSIAAVTPGSVTVSRGEFVDVSAEVHGLKDSEAIVLRYTAEDGQVVGKTIPMKPSGDGLRYTCRVSDDANGSESVGLTRSLTYRLEAGDARSLDYAITVISAPSILVERVDYHYPAYTGFVDRSVDGLGDIRAIEGTRMTIHARANGAIKVADVDFDADGRPDLRMTSKEESADASFELGLREDRSTPRHASYVLRFTNQEGRVNRDPVKHAIAVERDYDPEAAVLAPKEQAIDARADETVVIEIEARDPDFALSAVRLAGEVMHQSMLDEPLLKVGPHRGRFTARYSFVPSAHDLKAGDLFEYWIEASDNRTPKANMVATAHRTIRIVSPNPNQQPPANQVAKNDRKPQKPGEQQGGEQQQGNQQNGNQQRGGEQGQQNPGGAAEQQQQNKQQQGSDGGGQKNSGQSQGDQKSEKPQGGGEGGKNGQQNSGDQQKKSKDNSKSSGEGQGSDSQGGQQQDGQQKPGKQGQSGSQSNSANGSKDSSHDGQQQNKGEQTGASASGGETSKNNAQPDGTRPDQNDKSQQPNGGIQQKGSDQKNSGQQNSNKQPQAGEQNPAVSAEGDNDGEAIERMQKRMEQNGELKQDEKSTDEAGQKRDQQQGTSKEQSVKQEGNAQDRSKQDGSKPDGENSQQQQSGNDKSQEQGKSGQGDSAAADQKNGDKQGDKSLQDKSAGQGEDQNKSSGAKPNGTDASDKQGQKSDDAKGDQKSPAGQETGSKGSSGAGEQKQSQSTPNSQDDKKPTEKHQQSGSKEGTDKQDPASGGSGKKESDSSGDQGGDKTGGGEQGAGQKAPREGTGSAGDHQSADNGTGQSAEKGKGDRSSSGGKDAKSDHPTGSSDGKTQGKGSQQKDGTGNRPGGSAGNETAQSQDTENSAGEKGNKAGSREGEAKGTDSKTQQDGKSSDKQPEKDGKEVGKQGDQKADGSNKNSDQKGKGTDSNQQGSAGGSTEGGGKAGSQQPTITGTAPEGDAANLEYARKKTDLVLEKLSDQLNKNKVDDRMLKDLGWTRDDLKRFVDRWQQRKDAAQRDDAKGEAAKRELDDALRSLGLRRDKLEQSAVQKDSMRDLKQGYRGAVPLEYQERLRAYNQGVSRGNRDGE